VASPRPWQELWVRWGKHITLQKVPVKITLAGNLLWGLLWLLGEYLSTTWGLEKSKCVYYVLFTRTDVEGPNRFYSDLKADPSVQGGGPDGVATPWFPPRVSCPKRADIWFPCLG
jgi:hypothetical protein